VFEYVLSWGYIISGGEPGEENVDIDDDLAPTQFAPVEIDKDGGADGEGSSSGDSRDSGSSSSGMSKNSVSCSLMNV
jgi:hypothetical protein